MSKFVKKSRILQRCFPFTIIYSSQHATVVRSFKMRTVLFFGKFRIYSRYTNHCGLWTVRQTERTVGRQKVRTEDTVYRLTVSGLRSLQVIHFGERVGIPICIVVYRNSTTVDELLKFHDMGNTTLFVQSNHVYCRGHNKVAVSRIFLNQIKL